MAGLAGDVRGGGSRRAAASEGARYSCLRQSVLCSSDSQQPAGGQQQACADGRRATATEPTRARRPWGGFDWAHSTARSAAPRASSPGRRRRPPGLPQQQQQQDAGVTDACDRRRGPGVGAGRLPFVGCAAPGRQRVEQRRP
jgi:hypothetical protein